MNLKKLAISSVLLVSTLFAGSYNVDKSHSDVGFKVKHLMISNVKGNFNEFKGSFEYDEKTKTLVSLNGEIEVSSINTDNKKTTIFILLAFKAVLNIFEAPKYRANFKIRNTLKRRNARKAISACVPTKTNDIYFFIF